MSRFSEYDDYEGEADQILAMGRWEHNARVALKGKRGRKLLAELREALLALPERRLIASALCTAGAEKRKAGILEEEDRGWQGLAPEWRPDKPWRDESEAFAAVVKRQGEGVCAIGAWLWYRQVKAGADPAAAFDSLPLVFDGQEGCGDGLSDTADYAKRAGATFTLAWELAYRNDETFRDKTPEERWEAFVAWIDAELGVQAVAS
jgi:hypothetical protein